MRRFFITTAIISLTGGLVLHSKFHYSTKTIFYHLLIILFLNLLVFSINTLLTGITAPRLRHWLTNSINFIFLISLVLFYTIILGSNSFWGKAITFSIFKNYLLSFDEFISVLPVQKWILYTALTLLLIIICLLFWWVHPRPAKIHARYNRYVVTRLYLKRIAYSGLLLLVISIFTFRSLLTLKRNIHFSGEPILEFVYGPMWSSETAESVYDKIRIQNGMKDKPCIEAITREDPTDSNRTIVMILLDGLRKDFLSEYGYDRKTTPFLESLSKDNKLLHVNNYFSTTTTTLLGVGGLLCSKDWDHFSYSGLNLMKFLRKKGFTTYAFLTGYHQSWYGLTAIYKNDCDHFYESTTNPDRQNFDDLTTLEKFKRTSLDKNSFIYVHLLSTHVIGKKGNQFRQYLPDKLGIGSSQKTVFVNNYDNGILQADFVIKGIFDRLQQQGLLENASIYIVADHGELFGEDGRWSHSGNIHQDLLTIPLLIYDKDHSWYRNLEAGTILDLAPTVADRLGYPIPGCWQGRSLHQPVQDFSIKINSGEKCEFPEGILTRKDSVYRLEIMNESKKVVKVVSTTGNNTIWNIEH